MDSLQKDQLGQDKRVELVWGQSLILSLIEFGLFTELQRSGCVQLASGGGA